MAAAVGAVVRLTVRRALAEIAPLFEDAAALGLALVHVLVVDCVRGPSDVTSRLGPSAVSGVHAIFGGDDRAGRGWYALPPSLDVSAAVLALVGLAVGRALAKFVRLDVDAAALGLASVEVFVVDGPCSPGDVTLLRGFLQL